MATVEKWYPSKKTLYFVDWSLSIEVKRNMLEATMARAIEIIPSSVNLGEILKLGEEIFTNIPTTNIEDHT